MNSYLFNNIFITWHKRVWVWFIAGLMSTSIYSTMLIPISRHFWDNHSLKEIYSNLPTRRSIDERIKIETLNEVCGSCSIAHILSQKFPHSRIGIMVAASSGMPGGRIGFNMNDFSKKPINLYINKGSQEESVVANWIMTERPGNKRTDLYYQKQFFKKTFWEAWGVKEISRCSTSTETFQEVDFVTTENPNDFRDTWIKYDATISVPKVNDGTIYLSNTTMLVSLIFGAGPNTGNYGHLDGSLQRTRNRKAVIDYNFFIESIKCVLRAKFDAGLLHGITVFVVDRTSCGAYLGAHKERMATDNYHTLVQSVLDEEVGPNGEKRWQYILQAILGGSKQASI